MTTISAVAVRCIGAAVLWGLVAPVGAQQAYPAKPIRIISPYPAGGTTDLLARMLGPKVTEAWGQQVVVENRPGGNTVIGSEALVRAAPDGYTLLLILNSHVIVPNLAPTPYDVVKDFAAVATIGNTALALVVHPSLPVRSLRDVIALARNPRSQLNYGSGGGGTVTHLAGEYFNILAGVKVQHIPYKGSAQALTDVIGGQVHMYFSPPLVAMPHIRNGRLRAIAITSAARLSGLPELPTAIESGLKDFEVALWYGLLAPAATPRAIIDRWAAESARILALPDIREKLLAQGMEPLVSSPERFAALIKADFAKYANIIRTAGIRLEQ